MHGLIGKITARPGTGAQLRELLLAGTASMPGCLSYVIAADPDDADVLWITEVWIDAEAHAASLQLPAVQQAISEGRPLIRGMDRIATTLPAGPSHKPPGHPAVSSYLTVADAEACLAFIETTLGGRVLTRHRREDGSIMHAEVRVADSVIMVGQPEGGDAGAGSDVHVYLPDVDASFDRMISAGGQAMQAPRQNPGEADRRAGVTAPDGTRWWIATRVG